MARYDAFISYSHSANARLAAAIRKGLQTLAKPWNRRRALNVFLDQSSLEVSPDLRAALHRKLEATDWLIVVLSEGSAQSEWVGEEIAAWTATKSQDRIALVLADGELEWNPAEGDFDWERSTAASPALRGLYPEEPLWLDLRWTKQEPNLDVRSNHRFKDDLAALAAPLHGMSKEELVGEDLEQFRRSRRFRRAAVSGLVGLTIAVAGFAIYAAVQWREATQVRTDSEELEDQAAVQAAWMRDALTRIREGEGPADPAEITDLAVLLTFGRLVSDYAAFYDADAATESFRALSGPDPDDPGREQARFLSGLLAEGLATFPTSGQASCVEASGFVAESLAHLILALGSEDSPKAVDDLATQLRESGDLETRNQVAALLARIALRSPATGLHAYRAAFADYELEAARCEDQLDQLGS